MTELVLSRDPAHARHGSNAGQPLTRLDGPLKVTGRATYAADRRPDGLLHAVMAVSTIARGRVVSLDVAAAKAHPGVVDVMTAENRPQIFVDPDKHDQPFNFCFEALQNDRVRYANQPIAVVIAETLEAATEGAALLAPTLRGRVAARSVSTTTESYTPPIVGVGHPAVGRKGRRRGGARAGRADGRRHLRDAARNIHNAMEPHAIVAAFEGDRLIIDMPTQALAFGKLPLCADLRPVAGQGAGAQPLSRRRFRRQGPDERPDRARRARRQADRPAGQAGRDPRAALWAVRPPLADAPAAAARRRRRGPADGARPSRQGRDLDLRSFLRALGRCLAHALCKPGDQDLARSGAARHRHADVHARAGRGLGLDRARKRHRRDGGGRRAWTPCNSACSTTPRPSRSPASRSPPRRCANVSRKARRRSAGPAGRSRRARCATKDGLLVGWGVGVATFPAVMFQGTRARGAARRRLRPRRGDRARHGPGRLDGAGADRRRRAGFAARQVRVPLRHVGICPTAAWRAAPATPRRRGWRIHNAGGARHRQTRRPRDERSRVAALRRRQRRRDRPRRPAGAARRRDARRTYAAILARAGVAEIDGEGKGAADPAAQSAIRHARAWRGVRRGEGRSRPRHGAHDAGSSAPSRRGASSIRGW